MREIQLAEKMLSVGCFSYIGAKMMLISLVFSCLNIKLFLEETHEARGAGCSLATPVCYVTDESSSYPLLFAVLLVHRRVRPLPPKGWAEGLRRRPSIVLRRTWILLVRQTGDPRFRSDQNRRHRIPDHPISARLLRHWKLRGCSTEDDVSIFHNNLISTGGPRGCRVEMLSPWYPPRLGYPRATLKALRSSKIWQGFCSRPTLYNVKKNILQDLCLSFLFKP